MKRFQCLKNKLFNHSTSGRASRKTKFEKWISEHYYALVELGEERETNKRIHGVILHRSGMALVIQYYRDKYQANIVSGDDSLWDNFSLEQGEESEACEYRIAFLIHSGKDEHDVIPLIYIRENEDEGLLYAKSTSGSQHIPKKLAEKSGIPIYAVLENRQADAISCPIDALVFARDTTAIDSETKNYRLPSLLSQLKERATQVDHYYYQVKLPDELLKTSQLISFVKSHEEGGDKIIHKNETLEAFRKRYTDFNMILFRSGTRLQCDLPSYLREKGLKMITIIEMQFYINQLEKRMPNLWSASLRDQFIGKAQSFRCAKQESPHLKGNLQEVAEDFMLTVMSNQTLLKEDNMQLNKVTL